MNKVKKILAIVLVAVMALSLTACMAPSQPVTTLTVTEGAKDPDAKNYEDNYEGLVKYLKDSELIAGEGLAMSADFIGAEKGEKYMFKYVEAQISCELYYFDTENPNEKSTKVLESIKSTGKFASLDKEVDAFISDSGKFMMIYVNPAKDEVQDAFSARIIDKFKTFKGK